MVRFTLNFFIVAMAALSTAGGFKDVPHFDHRHSPHLHFPALDQDISDLGGEARAYHFLQQNAATYALSLENQRFVGEQVSLTATHYRFQQSLHGYDVKGGEIIVSIEHDKQSVYRVYNNIYPVPDQHSEPPSSLLTEDHAYDAAWQNLAVHGPLLVAPQAQLLYLPEGEHFRLIWVIFLGVDAPFGYWESQVDAITGQVISTRDTAISRLPDQAQLPKYSGPIDRRAEAFARFHERQARAERDRANESQAAYRADGTGLVFDPDPRTTLNDETLVDTSPAADFTAAYLTRNLLGLELTGGSYHFNGPWISIIDFESPATPPSTTSDGNWLAVRGDNAFNDATTYFQIDQNQRYMQSLGFTGAAGIQEGPIGTDSDGVNGQDNSHYIPSSNRMSFGHGCVDDSEDADVILHEYGHAIHYSINPGWGGADSGAIGEGFGDYWAGSYSYSTPNGPIMHPEWVFSWDGHSNCWPGRNLNRTDAMYDPSRNYSAHSNVTYMGATFQSDELWSAPIFNTMADLVGLGVPQEQADQIVLESHFGLGSGVTMRVLANSTIAAAGLLYPGGPHAEAYTSRFLAQNIVDLPHVTMDAAQLTVVTEPGMNGVADPGETVGIHLQITNSGNLSASQVASVLTSSDPMVTIVNEASNYPDLDVGAAANNLSEFTVTLSPELVCGQTVPLQLQLNWLGSNDVSGTNTVDFSLPTGVPLGMDAQISPDLPITDNNSFTSTLTVSSESSVSDGFNLDLNLSHTYIGDLIVTLTSPNGTTVVLHNRGGGSADDLVGNYPATLTPAESLDGFLGDDHNGVWTLTVTDEAPGDTGTLNSWAIHDVLGYECEISAIPCPTDLNGDRTIDVDDYNLVMEGWGTSTVDADGDGFASIIDMMVVAGSYGACPK